MNDYSLAILVGRLTADPVLRYSNPGGIPLLKMTLAITRQAKKEDGAPERTITFVEVTVWRRLAELCAQFLKKGSSVMVVGSVRQSGRTGDDGEQIRRIVIEADRVQFLEKGESAPAETTGKADEASRG